VPNIGQQAGKTGHGDLIENPEIQEFIRSADHLKPPSEEELRALAREFTHAPSGGIEPARLLATDGSTYESSIDGRYPSTRVGYVKVSNVVVDVGRYRSLLDHPGTPTVDPFTLNKLQKDIDALTVVLPSSNLRVRGARDVRQGFRLKLQAELDSERTRLSCGMLLDTLFYLASRTEKRGAVIGGKQHIRLKTCPVCEVKPENGLLIPREARSATCDACGSEILAADVLRAYETVTDQGTNQEALTRVMNALEVLLLAHYVRDLLSKDIEALSRFCFLVDGPLAVFGEPAWLCRPIQQLLFEANARLKEKGLPRFLVIGLQKTGPLAEHAQTICRQVAPDSIRVVDDDYRDRHITPVSPDINFGNDTYYGQDFIYRSAKGANFVVGLPYPFMERGDVAGVPFKRAKAQVDRYEDLGRSLDVLRTFECDLYANSLVPIIIAHRHASISRVPGGKVLDIAGIISFSERSRA
jgi:hypothetical protein